jgi:galacturan 1,4-alpha-galacturonidase
MIAQAIILSLGALAAANPLPANLADRAGCTFTDAASAIKGKTGCSTITLSGIKVPAGTTLDLTGLKDGTTVIFSGTTTFGYKEWAGPLISVSGNNILVEGASGHLIDGNGAAWWDGKGSNGGKTKPKYVLTMRLWRGRLTLSQILCRSQPDELQHQGPQCEEHTRPGLQHQRC